VDIAVVLFFFGLSAGTIGKIKGSSFWIWFLIGLVLPGLGTLVALLYRFESSEPRRRCPECGVVLALHVQVCPSCGRDLEFPEESAA
jgi:ribosomal protein S27AE